MVGSPEFYLTQYSFHSPTLSLSLVVYFPGLLMAREAQSYLGDLNYSRGKKELENKTASVSQTKFLKIKLLFK